MKPATVIFACVHNAGRSQMAAALFELHADPAKARGLVRWALGGFGGAVTSGVVETYVDDARAAGAFLKPGDEVTIHVAKLGVIRNRVVR